MKRIDPFSDLSDFTAHKSSYPVSEAKIDKIAEDSGFPSRKTKQQEIRHRYTTGRNQQINIKARPETIEQMHKLAHRLRVPLGAVLEQALNALEHSLD